jgi:hypothetical protein
MVGKRMNANAKSKLPVILRVGLGLCALGSAVWFLGWSLSLMMTFNEITSTGGAPSPGNLIRSIQVKQYSQCGGMALNLVGLYLALHGAVKLFLERRREGEL